MTPPLPLGGLTCDEARDLVPGFVLGALEAAEMVAVHAHLTECPEAHAEALEFGGLVGSLARSIEPVEPPAGLRSRILRAAAAEPVAPGAEPRVAGPSVSGRPLASGAIEPPASGMPEPPASRAIERPAGRAIERPTPDGRPGSIGRLARWRPRPAFALAAAAILAIVVLGAVNLALRGTIDELSAYRQGVTAVMDAAAAPGSRLAVLTSGAGSGPRGLAALRSDGTVVLAMRGLSPTTGSQVYETWLIGGDGRPVPVGGFAVGPGGAATFTSRPGPVSTGAIVALTLEPGPGATTPTLPIVSKGVASPPQGS